MVGVIITNIRQNMLDLHKNIPINVRQLRRKPEIHMTMLNQVLLRHHRNILKLNLVSLNKFGTEDWLSLLPKISSRNAK